MRGFASLILPLLFLLLSPTGASADNVNLAWDSNTDADLAGYKVYYGSAPGRYTIAIDVGNATVYTIAGLGPGTYFFAVTAYNAEGMESSFSNEVSTTIAGAGPGLCYPRMFLPTTVTSGDAQYTGVAITNLDTTATSIMFVAFSSDGSELTGFGISNPTTRILQPGAQLPILDSQLFGPGISSLDSTGKIEVGTTSAKVIGMFMAFDSRLTFLDGADIDFSPQRSSVLPEINQQGFTKLLLVNTESIAATVGIQLVRADGTVRTSAARTISGHGTLSTDLYGDIFPAVGPDPSDFVRISAGTALVPYEVIGELGKDVAILPGQDPGAGSTTLYSPQYVVGGSWQSTLSIINLDMVEATVTMRLVADNGSQIGVTKIAQIEAGGKLLVSDPAFFVGANVLGQLSQGYVEIKSSGARLGGSVVFGDAKAHVFTTALPLVSALPSNIVFGHVASSRTWFTGIAILNPNGVAATATVELYAPDGKLEATVNETIPAGQRRSQLLTEIFPYLATQDRESGYLRISVDQNVACFALFGTNDLAVLSAIPGRSAP